MKHLCINITGRVQGVFFRASALEVASKLGLRGFVRNEHDGSVYAEAEGEEVPLERFVRWCHQGPPRASVKEVIVTEGALKHFASFEIQH